MPGESVRLGPFRGGLNTASDPTSIADNELAVCENFEFDADGGLVSRPPITVEVGITGGQTSRMLGYFVDAQTGLRYLIGSDRNGVLAYYNPNTNNWVNMTTGIHATAMVQYQNKAWIIADPSSIDPGGSWTPPASFGSAGTWTADSDIPRGSAAVVYKERLFVAAGPTATSNDSRLSFSNIANFGTWGGSDFIDIVPGDGQKLIDIFVVGSSMYLFKADSTYVYQYDSSPTKGSVNNISKVVGVSGLNCVVQYENVLYVYHEDWVYELINYNFTKLNIKINFEPDYASTASYSQSNTLSIVGDRLVVRYFDKVYVFNFKTRTWSTWSSTRIFSFWVTEPRASNSLDYPRYFAGSALAASPTVYIMQDGLDATSAETFTCTIQTKVFDFDTPDKFKRLYWWGVDLFSRGNVTGTVVPVIYSFNVTWGSVASKTWGQMADFTWGQPGSLAPEIADTINTAGSIGRKFLKFLKAIRFRSVYFKVELTTTGTTATAPVKLFTINPKIDLKQTVAKDVN